MIDGRKRVLGLIPARGGSLRIPGKNLKILGGETLLERTIRQGQASELLDELAVSSEDPAILELAEKFGVRIIHRPPELARDETPGIEPVLHALGELPDYHYVVLLQVTSPFRSPEDIDQCLRHCVEKGAPACISVFKPDFQPSWMYSLDDRGCVKPLFDEEVASKSSGIRELYLPNGAVYVAECEWLLRHSSFISEDTSAYIMPQERSMDIDSPFDLQLARAWLKFLQQEVD